MSMAPDALKTPIATSIATRYGIILTAVVNPSFAPSTNASYTFTFFLMPARMKPVMITISRMLATDVLTMFICSLSICPKPHMMPLTARHMPPKVSRMVRFMRFIL